ncbi:MAG: sensor domain-containing diguanylate cyclase [Pseudohongiellaceae bacterium]
MTDHERQLTFGEVLDRLAQTVTSTDDIESLVRPLLEMLQDITGLESTYLTSIDPDREYQHVLYARNTRDMQIPEGLSVPWRDTLCKRALEEGRTYEDNVAGSWGDSGAARDLGITTYLSVPICIGEDEVYGTLCGASTDRVSVTPEARRILSLFAMLIARQLEHDRLLAHLRMENLTFSEYAMTDPLTGIPNRRALMVEMERTLANAARQGKKLYVAFIDLDGFKAINDQYGHDAGDHFLMSLTAALSDGLRGGDYLARFGGDELVFIGQPGDTVEGQDGAEALQRRLTELTSGSFDIGDGMVEDYPGASVGVVTAGAGETDVESLLRRADEAMYVVKQIRQRRRRFH